MNMQQYTLEDGLVKISLAFEKSMIPFIHRNKVKEFFQCLVTCPQHLPDVVCSSNDEIKLPYDEKNANVTIATNFFGKIPATDTTTTDDEETCLPPTTFV